MKIAMVYQILNSDEDENNNDYRFLMAYENDDFLDALDEDDLYEKSLNSKFV